MQRPRIRGYLIAACLLLSVRADAETVADEASAQSTTQDSIGDAFVEIFDGTDPDAIHYWPPLLFVVPIDINRDGRLDIMVSANFHRNGRQGQMWYVYLQADDGFTNLEAIFRKRTGPARGLGFIQFFYRSTRVRAEPDRGSTSFYGIGPGGGGESVLEETRLSESGMEYRIVALLNNQDPEDRARIQSLSHLFQPLQPMVMRMNFGPLQERFADKLHRDPLPLERSYGRRKDVSIDYRNAGLRDAYLESPEEVYALVRGNGDSTVVGEPPMEFEDVHDAISHYVEQNVPTWTPLPVDKLLQRFGDEALLACLESSAERAKQKEQFLLFSALAEIVERSSNSETRRRFVEQVLAGPWRQLDVANERDWIASFSGADFNSASRKFLLTRLREAEVSEKPHGDVERIIRYLGLAGVEEAIPLLREFNTARRSLKLRSRNPLQFRTALIALARMGDPDAIQEMIACIEAVEKSMDRALSLQRLAVARGPAVVTYLKPYLFSEKTYHRKIAGFLPVSEAECAADTLAEILEGFPAENLAAQRAWLENRTEYVYRPVGGERAFPGLH